MKNEKKWVHFVGICGVTMAPLAKMMKDEGYFVSGSDKGIFPPMSDYLRDNNIDIELGFKQKHLERSYYEEKGENNIRIHKFPDSIIAGNYIGQSNPEYKFAKEKGLQIKSFPQVLKERLIKSNSIVVAGTYGKTTCTALLVQIFKSAQMNPSYMIGGIPINLDEGIENTKGKWSIVEGDEYTSARFDMRSKFFHYKPEFLLLTSAAWEHTDVFKTRQDYIDNFKRLVQHIPQNGIIVAARNGKNLKEVLDEARCKVVTYEVNNIDKKIAKADWFNLPHKGNKETGEICIFNRNTKEEFSVKTNLIGQHNRENIIGCCALGRELGVPTEAVIGGVANFSGIRRRLELKFSEENLRIIDDHACSPPKVMGSLSALRERYSDWHISVVFEPNVGNRTEAAMPEFKGVFDQADKVIVPRLKPVKTKKGEQRIDGKKLAKFLDGYGIDVKYEPDDEKLVNYVSNEEVKKHIICFMGSYGFRRMIEEVVDEYR